MEQKVPGTNLTPEEAIDWLEFCCDQYYNFGNSPASDIEYDLVFSATRQVIPDHPFFRQRIRALVSTPANKVRLVNPVYPAKKIRFPLGTDGCDINAGFIALDKWLVRTCADSVLVRPNYNGLICVIYYEYGLLTLASTIGDGEIGKNVTEHIKRVGGVPFRLPIDINCEVRGTVTMRNSRFASFQENEFASSMSVIMSSMDLEDSDLVKERALDFAAWDLLINNKEFSLSETEKFTLLKHCGFSDIGELAYVKDISAIKNYCFRLNAARKSTGNERPLCEDASLGGIVITVEDREHQSLLGFRSKSPQFATLVRLPDVVTTTQVVDIKWQVSRYGTIIPVLILEPTVLEGCVISRIDGGNYAKIERAEIGIGSQVLIGKDGLKSPKVLGLVEHPTAINNAPTECPACGASTYREASDLVCLNGSCDGQLLGKLSHFVSVVIPDKILVSEGAVKSIYDANLARSPADLYVLTREALLATPDVGKVKARSFHVAIKASKGMSLGMLLHALSIPGVGAVWAEQLAQMLSLNGAKLLLPTLMTYELAKVIRKQQKQNATIPTSVIESFCNWFHSPANMALIQDLARVGIKTLASRDKKGVGLRACISGKMALTKTEITRLLEAHGYIVERRVTTKTKILICNTPLNTDSLKFAKKRKIEIIPEIILLARLKHGMPSMEEAYLENVAKTTDVIVPPQIIWQEAVNIVRETEKKAVKDMGFGFPNQKPPEEAP